MDLQQANTTIVRPLDGAPVVLARLPGQGKLEFTGAVGTFALLHWSAEEGTITLTHLSDQGQSLDVLMECKFAEVQDFNIDNLLGIRLVVDGKKYAMTVHLPGNKHVIGKPHNTVRASDVTGPYAPEKHYGLDDLAALLRQNNVQVATPHPRKFAAWLIVLTPIVVIVLLVIGVIIAQHSHK